MSSMPTFAAPRTREGTPCCRCVAAGALCYQHRHRQKTQKTQPKKGQKPRASARKTTKFTERRRARYLELLASGALRGAASKAVGVARSTPLRAMRDEPDFAAAAEEAEMQANSEVQRALFLAATEDRNVTAMQVWLYNRLPESWVNSQRREVHHKIPDSQRALFVQAAAAAGLSGPQLEAIAQVLEGADDDNDTQH